jgi:hypothetical protein
MAEKISLHFDIKFNQPITAFALAMGGYFPVAFTPSPFVLVDRSVVGILQQIGRTADRGDHEANKWWFDFLNSESYTLNPFLCAMEGDAQGTPSFEKFVSEFDLAASLLKEKLPKARIIKYQKKNYEGAYQLVEKLLARHTREMNFLIKIAPIVAERPSDREIRDFENSIISEAKSNNLSMSSFVVLAVLSCLYDDKHGKIPSVGKLVVKPMKKYNRKEAHNVLSDLNCLEALIAMNALTNNAVSFVTRDIGLCAFWCAINPKNHKLLNGSISFSSDLNKKLFPRLNENEIVSLIKRFG